MTTRTLLSVIQVTPAEGEPYCYLNWHPDLTGAQELLNNNGQLTDKILDIVDEVLDVEDGDEDEDEAA